MISSRVYPCFESNFRAVWISSIVTVLNMILVMILGLVMYAYYYDCDPQIINAVEKKDQMVPLFVMQVMGHLHGMPGLFLATTFSASLRLVFKNEPCYAG